MIIKGPFKSGFNDYPFKYHVNVKFPDDRLFETIVRTQLVLEGTFISITTSLQKCTFEKKKGARYTVEMKEEGATFVSINFPKGSLLLGRDEDNLQPHRISFFWPYDEGSNE